jgi:hypothetical protein
MKKMEKEKLGRIVMKERKKGKFWTISKKKSYIELKFKIKIYIN